MEKICELEAHNVSCTTAAAAAAEFIIVFVYRYYFFCSSMKYSLSICTTAHTYTGEFLCKKEFILVVFMCFISNK